MKAILKVKKNVIEEITNKIKNSSSITVVQYHGLTVSNLMELRNLLRKEDVEFKVYKNTLMQLAAKELKLTDLVEELVGPNALVFSNKDEISGPKILATFAKKVKALKLKAAIFEGRVVKQDELMTIANLPSRDVLISMFASAIISPLRSFALVAKAIAEQREQN